MFVLQRIARLPPAFADLLSKFDHLVDRLPPRQMAHVALYQRSKFLLAFSRVEPQQLLHHHGDHDVNPPRSNQRDRPVKVKQCDPGTGRGRPRGQALNIGFHPGLVQRDRNVSHLTGRFTAFPAVRRADSQSYRHCPFRSTLGLLGRCKSARLL